MRTLTHVELSRDVIEYAVAFPRSTHEEALPVVLSCELGEQLVLFVHGVHSVSQPPIGREGSQWKVGFCA